MAGMKEWKDGRSKHEELRASSSSWRWLVLTLLFGAACLGIVPVS